MNKEISTEFLNDFERWIIQEDVSQNKIIFAFRLREYIQKKQNISSFDESKSLESYLEFAIDSYLNLNREESHILNLTKNVLRRLNLRNDFKLNSISKLRKLLSAGKLNKYPGVGIEMISFIKGMLAEENVFESAKSNGNIAEIHELSYLTQFDVARRVYNIRKSPQASSIHIVTNEGTIIPNNITFSDIRATFYPLIEDETKASFSKLLDSLYRGINDNPKDMGTIREFVESRRLHKISNLGETYITFISCLTVPLEDLSDILN